MVVESILVVMLLFVDLGNIIFINGVVCELFFDGGVVEG